MGQSLIELTNDLEQALHGLDAGATEGGGGSFAQHAAGALIRKLRTHLFRQDQLVLPVLEEMSREERS